MTELDLAWLSGILEGEGCFHVQRQRGHPYARIVVRMTDEDVVARVARLMGVSYQKQTSPSAVTTGRKPVFVAAAVAGRATRLMLHVYPLMGRRRQQRIREILEQGDRRALIYLEREAA